MYRQGDVLLIPVTEVPAGHIERETCREAVAWTFGLQAKEYRPSMET